MTLIKILCCCLLATGLVGCGGPSPELSKPSQTVSWPELAALHNPDVSMGIFRTAMMGDLAGCKKALSDPKLEELLKAFEDSKIPSSFASPARETVKTKVGEAYRRAIGFAKGMGSANDLKTAVTEIQKLLGDLTNPDLK